MTLDQKTICENSHGIKFTDIKPCKVIYAMSVYVLYILKFLYRHIL